MPCSIQFNEILFQMMLVFVIIAGMNLQLCFVNDAAAEADSPSSDSESCPKLSKPISQTVNSRVNIPAAQPNPYNSRPLSMKKTSSHEKGKFLNLKNYG